MSAKQVRIDLDFGSVARLLNLLDAVDPQEPATLAQLHAAIEGLAWKDNVRVSTQSNINLSSPGASVDGITMAVSDRVLVRAETATATNGIYLWNGAAVAMTRSDDCSTAAELESAVTTVDEGTDAGVSYRQSAVNLTLGTDPVTWTVFGTVVPAASESTAGKAELATQAETDAGTDDLRIVTPLKLATWSGRPLKYSTLVGDGAATSYTITHNLNTRDLQAVVRRNSGAYDEIIADVEFTTVNTVTVIFA